MSASLPVIVIGPVLRRVEPRLVSVFVALREAASIHLSVYEGLVDAASPPDELAGGDASTRRFGASFHAVVATAAIAGANPLLPGHRYSYDLRIKTGDGDVKTLQSLLLLKDHAVEGYGSAPPASGEVEICAIGYAQNQLPSFVTPPERLEDLVIAHASCRKPHGAGHPAMQHLDAYLDDLRGAEAGWLHRLFLTGDQIYADDVASALLPGINSLGISLLSGAGGEIGVEEVPAPGDGDALKVNTMTLPAGLRQKAIGSAGLSCESAASHLIGFGEWLAMYCIAWNPDVWPVLAVADTRAPGIAAALRADLQADSDAAPDGAPIVLAHPTPEAAVDVITPLFGGGDDADAVLNGLRAAFRPGGEKSLLDAYRREVPKVRRLLANVPTYMIADDHEVTDDWFMTAGIRAACTGNPLGRAMLRNGMAAYAVCQAWGNDPARWSTDADRKGLLDAIAGLFGAGWSGGLPDAGACDRVDAVLGLAPEAAPRMDFSFGLDGPGHRVRVLDTRTRRDYRTPFGPPGLLTPEALDQQLPDEDLPEGHVLIVVSPAPVFGPAVMTELGGVLAASVHDLSTLSRDATRRARQQRQTGLNQGRPLGSEAYDAEHWGAEPAGFERLLRRLAGFSRVVVLGGDVHYAGAFAMDWSDAPRGGEAPRHGRIVHLTSSAARNAWMGTVRNLMLLNGMSVGLQRIGMPMTRLGWQATLPPVVQGLAEEPALARMRVQTGPVLLSDELFRRRHRLERPPEWAWRAEPVVDARAPADRPPAARTPALSAELPEGAAALDRFADLAAAHAQALGSAAIARGLQFLNNVGIVGFARRDDGLHVTQALHSLRPRPAANERAAAYVLHEARLEPVPLAMPDAVGRGA